MQKFKELFHYRTYNSLNPKKLTLTHHRKFYIRRSWTLQSNVIPNRLYTSRRDCKCKDRDIIIPVPNKKRYMNNENEKDDEKDKEKEQKLKIMSTMKKNNLKDIKEVDMLKVNVVDLPFDEKVPTEMDSIKLLKSFLSYLWPDDKKLRVRVVGAVGLLISAKLLNLQVPIVLKHVIDGLSIADPTLAIAIPGSAIIAYGVMRSASSLFHEFRSTIFSRVAQNAIRSVACKAFLHLHHMDLNWHLSRQTGGLSRAIDRGTRGIQQVLNAVLFNFFPTFLEIGLVAGLLAYNFGPQYAIVVGATIAAYFLFTLLVTRWRTKFRVMMNKIDNIAANIALDSLINFETVKYFNNEKLEVERYRRLLEIYDDAQIKVTSSLSFLNFGQNFIFSCGLVSAMYLASSGVATGLMTIGDLVMINGLLLQLAFPLNFLGSTYRETRQALIDMSAMFSLLDLTATVQDKPDAKDLVINAGEIVFDKVHFGYRNNEHILNGLSFKVPAGKKVAIVGTSGGGKTTILRLLYRFYDVNEGSIRIDGQDLRDVKQESLRLNVGVVPQDLVLFNDTILYNIMYGNTSSTLEDVERVAKLANIHDSILKMPNGYLTQVGERGLKLSGGEKQRICLARALLKNPPIVILDEATSSLDAENENLVQEAFENITSSGRTILMISHRLKTVYDADKIIVLDGGKVVEEGTHQELMKMEGVYSKLVEKQNLTSVEMDDKKNGNIPMKTSNKKGIKDSMNINETERFVGTTM